MGSDITQFQAILNRVGAEKDEVIQIAMKWAVEQSLMALARDTIDRLRAELAAERATTASLLRTIALIREAGGLAREDLDALPDAVKAMRQQRDEARREVCSFEAIDRWHKANPNGLSPCAVFRIAREIAAERGWQCFAQQEGGGA